MLLETLWDHPGYKCYGVKTEYMRHVWAPEKPPVNQTTPCEIYYSPNVYEKPDRENPGKVWFRSVYLDLDQKVLPKYPHLPKTDKELKEVTQKLVAKLGGRKPTALVHSGVGLHLYWIFKEFMSKEVWEPKAAYLRNIVQKEGWVTTQDGAVTTNQKAFLRPPGYYHWKTGVGLRVRFLGEGFRTDLYDWKDFPDLVVPYSAPSPPPSGKLSQSVQNAEGLLQKIIQTYGPEWMDERDNWMKTGFALVDALGKTEECRALFDKYSMLSPKFDQREQEKLWKSIDKIPKERPVTIRFLQNQIQEQVLKEESVQATRKGKKPSFDQLVDMCVQFPLFQDNLRFNSFSYTMEWKGKLLDDPMILDIRAQLGRLHQINLTTPQVHELAIYIGKEYFEYNPLRDWINALPPWDGTDHISFLSDHLGLIGIEKIFLRKFLVGAIARGLNPGIKRDEVLILQGKTDLYKSSMLRNLVPFAEWFRDDFQPSLFKGDKDQIRGLYGKWIVELPELDATRSAQAESLKRFFSQQEDHIRPPYMRTESRFLRQVVFTGTTNHPEFLNDGTGERRYWPVSIRRLQPINMLWVIENRIQLWAQAKHFLSPSFDSYCLSATEKELHAQQVLLYKVEDVWEIPIRNFLIDKIETTIYEVGKDGLGIPQERMDRKIQDRLRDILKKLEWIQIKRGSHRIWVRDFRAPEEKVPSFLAPPIPHDQ